MAPRHWRRLRTVVQALTLLLFLAIFVAIYTAPSSGWTKLFPRLDPLLMLTASLAGRTLAAGFWLALLTIGLTLLFGRAWCGWLCPLGTILEWISPQRPRQTQARHFHLEPPPDAWRVVKYVLLLVILFAALLGNQTLLFLDPITLTLRTWTGAIWPALASGVAQIEAALYRFDALWGPLDVLHEWVVYPLFRDLQGVSIHALGLFLFFVALVALNWWVPRFWCRYLCPLGGLLGLIARFALVRREVAPNCRKCALCMHHCPTGTIDPHDQFRSDPAECIVCFDCLVDCPQEGIGFRWVKPWRPAPRHAYDPTRREVVAGLGVAVAGVALAGVAPVTAQTPTLLRPPGATLTDFADLCLRCGACVRACPTQGLQPSLGEGGWQNVFTPRLVPRLGYCIYDCQACAAACPTGAIPSLPLADKQATPIGLARIDRNRCLPWAYNIPCIVCEEMCPIADKAVRLEEVEVIDGRGERVVLQRPSVVKERCIGCGFCEYKCPMGGEAAIRVYAPTAAASTFG